ncbi:hypothetical protein Hanom_Chr09g00799581 [Helianthus anomalus]
MILTIALIPPNLNRIHQNLQNQQISSSSAAGSVWLDEVSEEERKGYDGNDSRKPLLMAIKGHIYDVLQSSFLLCYEYLMICCLEN